MIRLTLGARGESTIGRVLGAAGADARRRDAGDAVSSSRSANAVDAPAPPEPFGRMGIVGSGSEGPANLCVARRQRCPRIASSSRLDLARNTYARGLLHFHHGLLAPHSSQAFCLGSGSGHVHRIALRRAPRHNVVSVCGGLGRAPCIRSRLCRLAAKSFEEGALDLGKGLEKRR